jgi:anti-sigma28 factor (negative regulator of flagellin synthesis)
MRYQSERRHERLARHRQEREARVREVRQRLRDGTYVIDPAKLAQRLVQAGVLSQATL